MISKKSILVSLSVLVLVCILGLPSLLVSRSGDVVSAGSLSIFEGIELFRFSASRADPDQGRITFVRSDGIWVMDADGKNRRVLTSGGNDPAWSADGTRIAFFRLTDDPVISHICVMDADGSHIKQLTEGPVCDMLPTWSPDGKQIAFERDFLEQKQDGEWIWKDSGVCAMNEDGSNVKILVEGQTTWKYMHPSWSPDGRKIAFCSTRNGKWGDIYVMNADGANIRRLTSNNNVINGISWSPDGEKIAFGHWRGTLNCEIYVMDPDGKNQVNLTNTPDTSECRPCWSPDGTRIVFYSYKQTGSLDICVMDADGSNVQNLTNTPEDEWGPDWWGIPQHAIEPAGKLRKAWGWIKAR